MFLAVKQPEAKPKAAIQLETFETTAERLLIPIAIHLPYYKQYIV